MFLPASRSNHPVYILRKLRWAIWLISLGICTRCCCFVQYNVIGIIDINSSFIFFFVWTFYDLCQGIVLLKSGTIPLAEEGFHCFILVSYDLWTLMVLLIAKIFFLCNTWTHGRKTV